MSAGDSLRVRRPLSRPRLAGLTTAAIVIAVLAVAIVDPAAPGRPTSVQAATTTTTARPNTPVTTSPTSPDHPDEEASLVLKSQTSWVAPEGVFQMHLAVTGVPADAQLAVRFYNKVGGRILFERSIHGEGLGSPLRPLVPSLPLDALNRDENGNVTASFPVSATTNPAFGVHLSGTGVYPVSVAVTDAAGRELDRFITYLVRLPSADTAGPSLAVSLIVPMNSSPGFQPDGSVHFEDGVADQLDAVASSLTRTPNVPLTLDANPETLDALVAHDRARGSSAVAGLSRSLAGRQVVSEPYATLDLGSWIVSPLDQELNEQLRAGPETVGALLGTAPSSQTVVANATTTANALDRLRIQGTTQVVIPEDQLGPLPPGTTDVTLTQTFAVETGSGALLPAAAADAELAGRLSTTDDPVLNAHLALADMAVLYLDRPNQSRGVVLSLPTDGSTSIATLDALITGLAQRNGAPDGGGRAMVSPVTADDLFRVTDSAPPVTRSATGPTTLVRPYIADPPESMGAYPSEVAAIRYRLAGLASLVGGATEPIQPLDRQVLVSGAMVLDPPTRTAYLKGVDTSITDTTGAILAPAQQNVTLTSRSGNIPLSLENQLTYPVDVRVILASEKLEFPNGPTMEVNLPPSSTTRVEIAVETRATGSFPLDVTIRSPDDTLTIATTRFTVRSTAVSGLGLAISIGAGVFLLVWWARHFRKVRRARRLVGSIPPTDTSPPGPEVVASPVRPA